MGDFRLSVKIHLTGKDGETREIDWWVNWWPDKPAKLYDALCKAAEEVGLEVDSFAIDDTLRGVK